MPSEGSPGEISNSTSSISSVRFTKNPLNAAWRAMSFTDRDTVNRMFANVGKSIAAFERAHPEPTYCGNAYEVAEGADLVVLVTEWNEFRQLDFNHLGKVMRGNAFLDCRNVYDFTHLSEAGFTYDCFGRTGESDAKH